MWNTPTKEQLAKIPHLYETEHIPVREKHIHLHFFFGNSSWYVAEFDGHDIFWGFCILNGDTINAEWGYFSFIELQMMDFYGAVEVECDGHWQVKTAFDVEKIRHAQGW